MEQTVKVQPNFHNANIFFTFSEAQKVEIFRAFQLKTHVWSSAFEKYGLLFSAFSQPTDFEIFFETSFCYCLF